jgi:hypothetical protein
MMTGDRYRKTSNQNNSKYLTQELGGEKERGKDLIDKIALNGSPGLEAAKHSLLPK